MIAMSHAIHRVEAFEIVGPYTLALRFEDGTQQRIDFRAVLEGDLFGPLQDPRVFNAVVLDREAGTVVWPNGADFDPATLHDWPSVHDQFITMARGWVHQSHPVDRRTG